MWAAHQTLSLRDATPLFPRGNLADRPYVMYRSTVDQGSGVRVLEFHQENNSWCEYCHVLGNLVSMDSYQKTTSSSQEAGCPSTYHTLFHRPGIPCDGRRPCRCNLCRTCDHTCLKKQDSWMSPSRSGSCQLICRQMEKNLILKISEKRL